MINGWAMPKIDNAYVYCDYNTGIATSKSRWSIIRVLGA